MFEMRRALELSKKGKGAHMLLNKMEGILPALETAHAFAYLDDLMPTMKKDQHIVINVSGRGDKDLNSVVEIEDIQL